MATKAELQDAIDQANASRDADSQIEPKGNNKGDLEEALTAAGLSLPEGAPAPRKASAKAFTVTAPLVQVILGGRAVQFYSGDVLPEGVTDESLEHLKSLGYVAEVAAPDAAESE